MVGAHPGIAECDLQQCATDGGLRAAQSKAFHVASVMFVDYILRRCRSESYDVAGRQRRCRQAAKLHDGVSASQ